MLILLVQSHLKLKMSKKLTEFFIGQKGEEKEKKNFIDDGAQSYASCDIVTPSSSKSLINPKPNPPLNYLFPKTSIGKRERSCQSSWLKRFPWLHYDTRFVNAFYIFYENVRTQLATINDFLAVSTHPRNGQPWNPLEVRVTVCLGGNGM